MTLKKVIVIGAGPAGLTAAYELLKDKDGYEVIVLEESNCVGGISRTVEYKGNRMDMGGHRFFSKVKEVNDWWNSMLPMQGAKPRMILFLVEILRFRKEDRIQRKRTGSCSGDTEFQEYYL